MVGDHGPARSALGLSPALSTIGANATRLEGIPHAAAGTFPLGALGRW